MNDASGISKWHNKIQFNTTWSVTLYISDDHVEIRNSVIVKLKQCKDINTVVLELNWNTN